MAQCLLVLVNRISTISVSSTASEWLNCLNHASTEQIYMPSPYRHNKYGFRCSRYVEGHNTQTDKMVNETARIDGKVEHNNYT